MDSRPESVLSSSIPQESDDQIRARCDFVAALQQHISDCEAKANYIEADKCKKRLDELYLEDRRARVLRLRDRHRQESDELLRVIDEETVELEEAWRSKLQQYEFKAQEQLQKAREKHLQQRISEEGKILEKINSMIPKASKTLLELRRAQQQLVRQGRYVDAEQYRVKGDALDVLEEQKRNEEAAHKVAKALETFDKRIEVEYQNLASRIKQGRRQLKEAQTADFDRLQKKQENIKRDLTIQQNAEMTRIRRAPMGLPFVIDEDGNDMLIMPNGVSELNKLQKDKKIVPEAQSFIRAYIQGDLIVRPGDVYFSLAAQPSGVDEDDEFQNEDLEGFDETGNLAQHDSFQEKYDENDAFEDNDVFDVNQGAQKQTAVEALQNPVGQRPANGNSTASPTQSSKPTASTSAQPKVARPDPFDSSINSVLQQ
ncbi:hypothetical protein SS50377_27316 [Spironucleus salmonicida]|uniref:Uncharacterized protein n=1 Tax=Spironucleus salmonicida TaxID=348837 RepID=V6LGG0_9EUKA|nr:hypothetical protein SS50377_27316 [Spironucleus salmonicida]|eukprot:EST43383.1 hypothetical protein SS50377_17063 [Spironucleus salmonicida]